LHHFALLLFALPCLAVVVAALLLHATAACEHGLMVAAATAATVSLIEAAASCVPHLTSPC
jgi:hypothetical protein